MDTEHIKGSTSTASISPYLSKRLAFPHPDCYVDAVMPVPVCQTLLFLRTGTTWSGFWIPRPFHSIRHQLIFDEWMTSSSFQGMTAGGRITENPFKAIYRAGAVGYRTVSYVRHAGRTQRSWPFPSRWSMRFSPVIGFGPRIFFTENSPKEQSSKPKTQCVS